MDGDVYMPLFERLETELAEMKRARDLRDRARAYLDTNRHKLVALGVKAQD